MYAPRRTLLFMPGDQRSRIDKGAALGRSGAADALILDLEDGVALAQKAAARAITAAALHENDFGAAERIVRINPVDETGGWLADLGATVAARPGAYLIAKTESADQVSVVAGWLDDAERSHGWPSRSIGLLVLVETARGIAFLREIAACAPGRLTALCFGAEDLAGTTGAVRQPDLSEAAYARSALVLHAKAFGLHAIDTPCIRYTPPDLPALAAEAAAARILGYDGKLAIHPAQLDPIRAAFTPSAEEVDAARRLIDAYDTHQAAGVGAFAYEGRMIDLPAIRHARHVLARAGG